ncbi:hypothetical protein FS837_009307 [Tulasnella sp. UAMH 9824]|nr:hypothetical protein FS837_009307 [Tulasnella sp. UAMH 9824]
MSRSSPPDPGEAGTGPPLRIIETEDIEIFSDIKWIQPGRFSDILYGYCHSLAETVALKRLRVPDDGECSARDLRLFNEEATIWHTLDHPHVLPLRGIYVCPSGFTYLVSPYMDNGDLMSYLKHNPLVDRRGLLCDIASAIAYLHSLEIIHGDIKARNILVSQDGEVRLCDFGLSKYSSWTTSEGRKGAGTIRWQSPELLFDESKSFKSDVYAFGITIYEVLSGNIPFGSSSDGAIVYNVVLRNTRPPCLPKFSPTGQSYATTWALARECWHRVADSRPDMVAVWKRLEMEVFPDATLRVMLAEKARMTAESTRVFKGGTSATGGVGPPARASAAGRGRTFTVDAASDDEDDAEESDNELGHRRHTIDVDAISRPTLGRTAEPASYAVAIDEDFTLDGQAEEAEDDNRVEEELEVQPAASTKRVLPGVPAKDSKNLGGQTKRGGKPNAAGEPSPYFGTGSGNPVGSWMPWSTTKSIGDSSSGGGGNPTKSGRRRKREEEACHCDCHCSSGKGEDYIHHRKINGDSYPIPGKLADDSSSSSGYYGSLLSAFSSAYEYTKSMITGGRDSTKSIAHSPIETKSTQDLQKLQPTIDWANWDGAPVSALDGA